MHKAAGEKRKALKSEARELQKEAKIMPKTKQMAPVQRIRKRRQIGSRLELRH